MLNMQNLFNKTVSQNQNKIICLAKNYHQHISVMSKQDGHTDAPEFPVIFLKPYTTIYQGQELEIPKENEIHHEIELGFMITKGGKNIKKENAMSHIGAYFVGLDLTDRNFQLYSKERSFPWDLSKGQDNFLPISSLVPPEKINDPYDLDLKLTINGKIVQNDNTNLMIHKIEATMEYVSKYYELHEGDLFMTGTPSGIGPIKQGDKLNAQLLQKDEVLTEINLGIL